MKNKGISLIYVLIFSFLFTISITSLLIYTFEMNNIILVKDESYFKERIIKDLQRSELIFSKEIMIKNIFSEKLSTMFIDIKDVENIYDLSEASYFNSSIFNEDGKFFIRHIYNSDNKSFGNYKIKESNKISKDEIILVLSKKIGNFEINRKEKIKVKKNKVIKIYDLGFLKD